MPMNPAALTAKMKATIYNGLKAQFSSAVAKGDGYTAVADEQWEKMATAISLIAVDIIMEIVQNATVAPGIAVATAGSPVAQTGTTVSPGKIL